MATVFKNAWGYQGDPMNLPTGDVDASAAFYEKHFGFRVESRSEVPHASAVLVRDEVRFGLAENGGDPTQDGCAFEVDDTLAARGEIISTGLTTVSEPKNENRADGSKWLAFFVTAPDGLCFWLGQRL